MNALCTKRWGWASAVLLGCATPLTAQTPVAWSCDGRTWFDHAISCGATSVLTSGATSALTSSVLSSVMQQAVSSFLSSLFSSGDDAAAQRQRAFERELANRRAEAERKRAEEEARQREEAFQRLNSELKLVGLPGLYLKGMPAEGQGLQLKGVDPRDSNSDLQLKLGTGADKEGARPYAESARPCGIPGLPGVYVGGPQTANPGLCGVYFSPDRTPESVREDVGRAAQLVTAVNTAPGGNPDELLDAALNAANGDRSLAQSLRGGQTLALSEDQIKAFQEINAGYAEAVVARARAAEVMVEAERRNEGAQDVISLAHGELPNAQANHVDPSIVQQTRQALGTVESAAHSDEDAWQEAKTAFEQADVRVVVRRAAAISSLRVLATPPGQGSSPVAAADVAIPVLGRTPQLLRAKEPRGQRIVNCPVVRTSRDRLAAGLPQQKDAIHRTEAQLVTAWAEGRAATAEARKELKDGIISGALSLGNELLTTATALRSQVEALAAKGLSRSDRRLLIETAHFFEQTGEVLVEKLPKAGPEYLGELQSRSHTLTEHLLLVDRLFEESGVADAVRDPLAKRGGEAIGELLSVRGGGPFGVLLFHVAKLAADAGIPALQSQHSQAEYMRAQANLDVMRWQYRRAGDAVASLDSVMNAEACL
jgi:hypothetical protein